MNMLADIVGVLTGQWLLISCLLGVFFGGMLITSNLLKITTQNHLTAIEYFSLGISGCLMPVLFWTLLVRLLPNIFDPIITAIAFAGIAFILLLLTSRQSLAGKIYALLILLLILLFSIAINMAFISHLTFPPYFDSAEHYRIIKFLLQYPNGTPTSNYYHVGYHFILVAITKLTGAGSVDGMLVSGQIVLSLLAFSLVFMVSRETGSKPTSFFAALLAGFGWYMPAHAINWGKYPAIFGLLCATFVFGLLHLMLQKESKPFDARRLLPFLLVGIVTATMIHTRSLVVCGMFAAAMLLANLWETFDRKIQRFVFGSFLLILIIGGIHLRADDTFTALLSPYLENDFPTICLVFLLGIFSIWRFPRFTFALFIFMGMMFYSLYIPVNGLFGYSNLFLLDRPYVQIVLHIPLSIIGGLGFAGLCEALKNRNILGQPTKFAVQLAAFGMLVINAVFYQNYYPSDCCQLADRDDVAAFSWIQGQPSNASFLIASQNVALTPDTSILSAAGLDAGIWLSPITDRRAVLFSNSVDFSLTETYSQICSLQVDFIYVGNQPGSFNESGLLAQPMWYQRSFALPDAKIYQVSGCS